MASLVKFQYFHALTFRADDDDFTYGEFCVLAYVWDHADSKTLRCFPSYELLAEEARVDRSTVKRAVKKAKQLGWLSIESGRGRNANVYTLTIPKGIAEQLDAEHNDSSSGVTPDPTKRRRPRRSGVTRDPTRDRALDRSGVISDVSGVISAEKTAVVGSPLTPQSFESKNHARATSPASEGRDATGAKPGTWFGEPIRHGRRWQEIQETTEDETSTGTGDA